MALSLAKIIICSLIIDWLFRKIKCPGLIGILLLGIIFGSYGLNWINPDLLSISGDLRMIALIVILLRAGFQLSKATLNRVGKTALKLSFIPATFEATAIFLFAPYFLNLSPMESAILGFIIAAVSPAVVVPLMIRFMEEGKGVEKGIPTLVLAGASLDDIYAITIFNVLIGIYTGHKVNIIRKLSGIPLSIILGIGIGLLTGFFLYTLFERFNPRATKRVILLLGISILLVQLEHYLRDIIPFAALLAVISIGVIILERREKMAHEISMKLSKIWVFAEIILFVMVGAKVNVPVALKAGLSGIFLIVLALVFRSFGTYLCVANSHLSLKEKLFVVISYLPKATVQAAIGAVPLNAMKLSGMDTQPGEIILAMAVLSILLTAPLGALGISIAGDKWLKTSYQTFNRSRG